MQFFKHNKSNSFSEAYRARQLSDEIQTLRSITAYNIQLFADEKEELNETQYDISDLKIRLKTV
jgi:hypothetical protein